MARLGLGRPASIMALEPIAVFKAHHCESALQRQSPSICGCFVGIPGEVQQLLLDLCFCSVGLPSTGAHEWFSSGTNSRKIEKNAASEKVDTSNALSLWHSFVLCIDLLTLNVCASSSTLNSVTAAAAIQVPCSGLLLKFLYEHEQRQAIQPQHALCSAPTFVSDRNTLLQLRAPSMSEQQHSCHSVPHRSVEI